MKEFARGIRSGQLLGFRLDQAIAKSAERAKNAADPGDKVEFEKILKGMTIQTSSVQPSFLDKPWVA
jgi:hypothetical protein